DDKRIQVTCERDPANLPFFRLAARGLVLDLARHERRFNLVFAADVVDGIVAAGEADAAPGRTYFLTDPRPYAHADAARALSRVFGRRLRRIAVPDPVLDLAALAADGVSRITGRPLVFGRHKAREMKTRWWLCSPGRAEGDFGWRSRVSLEDGVRATARWYREAGWL
ncbi:MAG: NAD-dependent epimerase/dehydratase family protein, partial [Planctomycetota bacterium]